MRDLNTDNQPNADAESETGAADDASARRPAIDLRLLTMVLILVAMWVFFRIRVGEFYFSGDSVANLLRDMATWTILAAGMTLIIVAGHIDLSVGSLLALCAASCALMMSEQFGYGLPASVAVPITLAIGLGVGLFQGVLVAYFRIPAFIVTLAGLFIYRGITQKVSARDPRVPDDSWVLTLGFGHVPPAVGWAIAAAAIAAVIAAVLWRRRRRRRLGLATESTVWSVARAAVPCLAVLALFYKVNEARGLPAQATVMAAVLLALYLLSRHTRFGRHVFAIGGNAEAARLSGIRVERTTVAVFAIMGLLAGVAGVVWMAQNLGSTKNAGQWYELYAIAACVIGGTSLMGGRGTLLGTLTGALVMATIIQGMDYTNLENWLQLVVRGAAVAVAVGIDVAARDPAPWMLRLRAKLRLSRG